jgi:dehydrogenase/reductase SDR family protein 12
MREASRLAKAAFLVHGLTHSTQQAFESAQRAPWWPATEAALAPNALEGKVVAVTGANAGLGLATAAAVARLGATTLLLCRSAERGAAAADAIRAQLAAAGGEGGPPPPPPRLEVEQVDVSSLASVRAFAARFEATGRPLHCLVNNAGILTPGGKQTVAFGGAEAAPASAAKSFEASFATNVLGPTALTLALKPALLRAAAAAAASNGNGNGKDTPRVVFVSSGGMYTCPLLSEPPLDAPYAGEPGAAPGAPPFDGARAYSRDKRRQVCLAEALGRRWRAEGILVASFHPGWADTPGVQTSLPAFREKVLTRLRQPEGGADTAVWMACAPADLAAEGSAGDAPGPIRPAAFYLDRRAQPKHLLGASGWLAGTAYTAAEADALLTNVVALLRECGDAGAAA